MIEKRNLPNGKPVSALGFGCSSIWARADFDAKRARDIIETAAAGGINYFDTSPSYACGEDRLGSFLSDSYNKDLVISTKVGTEVNQQRSFDPMRMRESFRRSLQRIGVAKVDILYLHGPSLTDLTENVFAFFDELKAAGQIDYAGVNSFEPEVVAACVDMPIDAVMLQYSIGERRFDHLINDLADNNKFVMAGTILAQGIFDYKTFLPRNRKSLWYSLRAFKNDPLFILHGWRIAQILKKTGLGSHEAALSFAVSHPKLLSCLFGTSSTEHMRANIKAAEFKMQEELIEMLRRS